MRFFKYIKHQYILPLLSVSCQSALILIPQILFIVLPGNLYDLGF